LFELAAPVICADARADIADASCRFKVWGRRKAAALYRSCVLKIGVEANAAPSVYCDDMGPPVSAVSTHGTDSGLRFKECFGLVAMTKEPR
jgi:hypothetical protein